MIVLRSVRLSPQVQHKREELSKGPLSVMVWCSCVLVPIVPCTGWCIHVDTACVSAVSMLFK